MSSSAFLLSPSIPHFRKLHHLLDDFQRQAAGHDVSLRLAIEERLAGWSFTSSLASFDSLRRAAHAPFPALRSPQCVLHALNDSNARARALLRQELDGIDLSAVWSGLWEVLAESALFLGGGIVIGGAGGAALGFFAGGAGAVPGAMAGAAVGAQVAGHIMTLMGLPGLVEAISEAAVEVARAYGGGFAHGWQAGRQKPEDAALYARHMQQATEHFARGHVMLVRALVRALVQAILRGGAGKARLLGELGKSRLGPGFGSWLQANEARLVRHAALQPPIKAEARTLAPPAKPPSRLKTEEAKPVETPTKPLKEGEGLPCKSCVTTAHPVNPIFGCKLLEGGTELDFELPAPLPLPWQRVYCSDNPHAGWLGQGWSLPVSLALQLSGDEVIVLDAQHRQVTFTQPAIGASLYSPYEHVTLQRLSEARYALVDSDGLRHVFERHGDGRHARLVEMRNANQLSIHIQYNGLGQPARILDSAGRTLVLQYETNRLRGVALQKSHVDDLTGLPVHEQALLVQYEYDAAGDLVAVRNRAGEVVREYAYRNHMLVRHATPGALVAEYAYSEEHPGGQVLRHWTNAGHALTFAYLPGETRVTDQLGRTQSYRYDSRQRLTGQTDAAGGTSSITHNRHGHPASATDAAGRTTRYRHDARGRLIAVEQPDGATTKIAYDPLCGKPALITDAMGGITALRYDELGNLSSLTDALGQRTAYRYGAHGLPTVITDAAGRSRQLAYNDAGQVIGHTDCSGQTTRYGYDAFGQLAFVTDALGQTTSYRYDAAGRLTAAVHADGSEERLEYDRAGRLAAHLDAAGRRTAYALDADGLPQTRTDALGHTLHCRYDKARRLAQLVNENGAVHAFAYDALDRLQEEIGFDGRLTRYRYDAAGLPLAKEEHGSPAGASRQRHAEARIDTHYERDAAGRLVEKLVSRITGPAMAEQLRTRYRYDRLGRLVQAGNAQAEVELEYDAIGQLVAETVTGRHHASRLAHAYDALGNRIQTTLPDGRRLNQLFYGSGHLHQVNLDGQVICDIERDGLHREVSRSQGALRSLFQYDRLGRLTNQQVGSLAGQRRAWQALDRPELDNSLIARRYDYDRAGELIAIDDARLGRTAYHYDALGRILSAVHPNVQERFAFDPAHNLLDETLQDQGGRIEHNRVTVFEDKRYAYDVHGDLTGKKIGRHTELALQWNGEHQLLRATTTRQAHTDAPATQTVTYGYDPFGRRLYKQDAFGITHFVWDGNWLLEEVRGSHARTYVYQPESFVPLAQVNRLCKPDDEAEQGKQPAQVLHIHTDHLGTPREMTDEQGQLRWAASYRAWGNVLRVEMPQGPEESEERARPSAFEEVQPLRFQGQYHDAETGLHYNRFRYYDPDCGRFVGQDLTCLGIFGPRQI